MSRSTWGTRWEGASLRGRARGLVVCLMLSACGGDGPTDPPGPVPGTLAVRLTVPAGAADRAVQLEVGGPAIQSLRASGALELYGGAPGSPRGVILVGSLQTGTVLTLEVADTRQVSAYSARVVAVAGGDYRLGDPSRYQATIAPTP